MNDGKKVHALRPEMMAPDAPAPGKTDHALGARLRDLRRERGWTLEEAADRCGVARSTLSKIENDQMSPTFDLLTRLTAGFDLNITELFVALSPALGAARRAVTRAGEGQLQQTPTYVHEFLCTDIVRKQMLTFTSRLTAHGVDEFAEWVRHEGEEFLYVLEGSVQVLTEFYEPTHLNKGDSMYFDSRMGHCCLSTSRKTPWFCGCARAEGALILVERRGTLLAYALQQLINGVSLGMVYGLIAIGYTMVYGIIGMINFAHGDVFMVSSFVSMIAILALSAMAITYVPLALVLALLFAAGTSALYGWAIERVAYRPLRGSFRLAPLISAIGMSTVLQNFVQVSQGSRVKSLKPMVTGGLKLGADHGFAVQISWIQITIVITTVAVLAAFTWLVARTSIGRAIRASEQDARMASLLGIDTNAMISLTFVIGSALAAVAGLMFLLYYGVIDFYIGFLAGVKAFTAAVLGGIGSLPAAVLGGLLIGLVETFWSAYLNVEYKDVAVFSVLALVLIFKPSGLLGRDEMEKV